VRLIALFSIAALVALALETTIPHWLPVGAFMPDLVLILVVDLGLRQHGALSALMAFAMGYATDSFSGTHIGLNALLFTLVFLSAYGLSRQLLSTSTTIGVIAVFFGVILRNLGDFIILGWGTTGGIDAVMPMVTLQAAISALVAPLIFALMSSMKRAVGLRQQGVRE
jgi:rod shape-determining protein MreD